MRYALLLMASLTVQDALADPPRRRPSPVHVYCTGALENAAAGCELPNGEAKKHFYGESETAVAAQIEAFVLQLEQEGRNPACREGDKTWRQCEVETMR